MLSRPCLFNWNIAKETARETPAPRNDSNRPLSKNSTDDAPCDSHRRRNRSPTIASCHCLFFDHEIPTNKLIILSSLTNATFQVGLGLCRVLAISVSTDIIRQSIMARNTGSRSKQEQSTDMIWGLLVHTRKDMHLKADKSSNLYCYRDVRTAWQPADRFILSNHQPLLRSYHPSKTIMPPWTIFRCDGWSKAVDSLDCHCIMVMVEVCGRGAKNGRRCIGDANESLLSSVEET